MVALLFNTVTLPASIGVALRSVSCAVASSVKSVWRAHASHALRWPASETVIGVLSFPTTDAVASETSDWRFSSARSGLPASAFGKCAKVSFSAGSFAPNKSFKPTPHRGVNSVLYATLHAVATPPRGGLTTALGGRKAFGGFAFQHGEFTGFGWRCSSVCFPPRCFFGQVRLARSHIACVTLAGFGNGDWCGQFSHN